MYVAGDCSGAYSPAKLEYFTRQIVFLRPGTFVVFDRVCSTQPEFKRTWLLQAMSVPSVTSDHLIVTNGKGRLFVQTLLPEHAQVRLAAGEDLYRYDGHDYTPQRDTGPAPQCRIEVSAPASRNVEYFLHVLTATDANTIDTNRASVSFVDTKVHTVIGDVRIVFATDAVGAYLQTAATLQPLAQSILSKE